MKPNNPPAFPQKEPWTKGAWEQGMTLRDYFAAAALSSLIAEGLRLDHKHWDATAQHAYIIADKMLEERAK